MVSLSSHVAVLTSLSPSRQRRLTKAPAAARNRARA